jgi:hypothetical protein
MNVVLNGASAGEEIESDPLSNNTVGSSIYDKEKIYNRCYIPE